MNHYENLLNFEKMVTEQFNKIFTEEFFYNYYRHHGKEYIPTEEDIENIKFNLQYMHNNF